MGSGGKGELLTAGRAGHINVDSGHGAWPEGKEYLRRFVASVCEIRVPGHCIQEVEE
jgi:predicted alpha/beta hydrolase family esterase